MPMHPKLVVSDIVYPDWPLETLGISVVSGDPKGTKSRWIIRKACKKVFVLRSPEPMG
jgi:hypothetical protein